MATTTKIEYIRYRLDTVLGIIVPYGFGIFTGHEVEGVKFFTEDNNPLQFGYLNRKEGYEVEPHCHNFHDRQSCSSQEILYIRKGIVRVTFYTSKGYFVAARELAAGDWVMFLQGGHSIKILKDAEMFEVKQGPYLGPSKDKMPLVVKDQDQEVNE